MEQYEDIKSELQQELHDLQQNVEQHSIFNKEVWQRAVKRYSKQLYRKNLFSAIFLVIVITASNLILQWPWWLLLPVDIFLAWIVLDSLISTNGLRKADVQSREGLLSLRESMRKSSSYSKRKQIIIRIIALILLVVMFIYLYLYERDFFASTLIGCIAASLVGPWFAKRTKRQYDDLREEIDELLKE